MAPTPSSSTPAPRRSPRVGPRASRTAANSTSNRWSDRLPIPSNPTKKGAALAAPFACPDMARSGRLALAQHRQQAQAPQQQRQARRQRDRRDVIRHLDRRDLELIVFVIRPDPEELARHLLVRIQPDLAVIVRAAIVKPCGLEPRVQIDIRMVLVPLQALFAHEIAGDFHVIMMVEITDADKIQRHLAVEAENQHLVAATAIHLVILVTLELRAKPGAPLPDVDLLFQIALIVLERGHGQRQIATGILMRWRDTGMAAQMKHLVDCRGIGPCGQHANQGGPCQCRNLIASDGHETPPDKNCCKTAQRQDSALKTGLSTNRTKTEKIITSMRLPYFGNYPNTILHPHGTWRHPEHKTYKLQMIVSLLTTKPSHGHAPVIRHASARITHRLPKPPFPCCNTPKDQQTPSPPEMPWPSLIQTSPSASKKNICWSIATPAPWPTPPKP